MAASDYGDRFLAGFEGPVANNQMSRQSDALAAGQAQGSHFGRVYPGSGFFVGEVRVGASIESSTESRAFGLSSFFATTERYKVGITADAAPIRL